jgi:hypothetical protein
LAGVAGFECSTERDVCKNMKENKEVLQRHFSLAAPEMGWPRQPE